MTAIRSAQAVVQRVDHGEGQPLTLAQAVEAARHPLAGTNREDLIEVVAYLACQVVGYAHRADADAGLALAQIRTAVKNYDRRHGAA